MAEERLVFRVHAIQRMFENKVNEADVRLILKRGEVIEEYPEDEPFPSRLILGYADKRPFHVVVARDEDQKQTIIVTVYEPDLGRWKPDFKTRRKK